MSSTTASAATAQPEPGEPELDASPGAGEYVTIHRTNPNWAAVFALADALAAEAAPDVPATGTTTGTISQWASALANLRDHLQGAGVPPETTDTLVIRHDGTDTWLTNSDGDRRIMLVGSPHALEDAQYGLAWAYSLGRPQIIRTEPIPYAERASQRAAAAV